MGGYGIAKFTDMIVATFRKCRDLVSKVFVENKAEVPSGVGCGESERGVVYFRKLLFKSNKKKFSFRRVESKKIGSHPLAKRSTADLFLDDCQSSYSQLF